VKFLYIAELVGKAGIYALKKVLPQLKEEKKPDCTIVCGDGATGGNGLGRNHAAYIRKLGADLITTGDCCFYKKDLVENMGKIPYVLRPLNLGPDSPGLGYRVYKTAAGRKFAAAVFLGQSGFSRIHGSNPLALLPSLLEKLREETPFIVIDFHASASGEKRTLMAAMAGQCTAIIGSHNRVQTADEGLLKGTAVICDAGRTGSAESVGGADIESRIREYRTGIPEWTIDAWEKPELQGVFFEADDGGRALSIERIQIPVPGTPPEPGNSEKTLNVPVPVQDD
jgi:metallophosphoesterase (TIGR00282 family)